MLRYFYIGNRRIEADEVENVAAIRGAAPLGFANVNDTLQSRLASEFKTGSRSFDSAFLAFRAAQWNFVGADREARGSLEAQRESEQEVGILIRLEKGELAIAGKTLTVQLKAELSSEEAAAVLKDAGLSVLRSLGFAKNLFEVNAANYPDALAASVALHDNPKFVFAEPTLIEHIPPRLRPSDPFYGKQWQWHNTGQDGGLAGADVKSEAAWELSTGAGIVVSSIDNGFDVNHEDLAAGIAPTSGYFTQPAGMTPPGFTLGTAGMPVNDHGTFCAGMIGARVSNGRGGCGAAPECSLQLISCLGDQVGTQTTLARAIAYAADPTQEIASTTERGADIITCSLGPNGADWTLRSVLKLALEFAATAGRGGKGLCIFWASSNGFNVDIAKDEVVSHPDVIAVGRSTRNDTEDSSARGPKLELLAPGVDVFSTVPSNGYSISTGTSFAAPCAAGCAALVLSVKPDLSGPDLRAIVRDTAEKIGGNVYDANGHSDDYGYGRVDALKAVEAALAV